MNGLPPEGPDSQPEPDMVNHAPHHKIGGIESIDVIEAKGFGEGYCAGNIMKYLMRYRHKGTALEDLKKARWYLNRLIERVEKEEKEDDMLPF